MTESNGEGGQEACLLVGHCTGARVAGISLGFEMLVRGFASRKLACRVIDLSTVGATPRPGRLRLARVFRSFALFISYLKALRGCPNVYMTISSSTLGFLRDSLFIQAAAIAGRRLTLHLKGGGYRPFYDGAFFALRPFIRATLARADRILVLGEYLVDQFDFLPASAQRNVRVVRNGLPEAESSALCTGKRLEPGRPVRLLYLSNMIQSKGYEAVLEACRILSEDGFEYVCDFCGEFVDPGDGSDGDAKAAERKFLGELAAWKPRDQISYSGVVRGKEKYRRLQSADVFLLPTLFPWEGQPMSIIEAMAAGVPVVATRHRGIPEQVIDRHNGFLLDDQNPGEIADAVRWVTATPSRYHDLSVAAHELYSDRFDAEQHLDRLIGMIRGLDEAVPAPPSREVSA